MSVNQCFEFSVNCIETYMQCKSSCFNYGHFNPFIQPILFTLGSVHSLLDNRTRLLSLSTLYIPYACPSLFCITLFPQPRYREIHSLEKMNNFFTKFYFWSFLRGICIGSGRQICMPARHSQRYNITTV